MEQTVENTANTEKLYENDLILMYYDIEKNIIFKNWKAEASETKFRDVIINLLMMIIQTKMKYKLKNMYLLADVRLIGKNAFTQKNLDWLDKEIHRVYSMNKIPKKAFVTDIEDTNANLTVTKYITAANESDYLQMNLFHTIEDALAWLK